MTTAGTPEAERAITVVGSGYVGTVVAACFASFGHRVTALEIDQHKLASLRAGTVPFHEPGLQELVAEQLAADRLSFTDDTVAAVHGSEAAFLCVGTPSGPDGHADVSALEAAARSVGAALRHRTVVVTKSTVPVGTGRWLQGVLAESMTPELRGTGNGRPDVSVVSNPEFLREGSAIHDFLRPDRVVLGGDDPAAVAQVAALYAPLLDSPGDGGRARPTLVRTGLETAEMVKYASNAFLATKISFANEIARICDGVGADVTEVMAAAGLDSRIGRAFLDAGVGWGGSCFGKDVRELAATSRDVGHEPAILQAAIDVNLRQRDLVVDRVGTALGGLTGRRVAVLGLAFKPGTDDLRDAPSLDIIRALLGSGATVAVHDPMASVVSDFAEVEHADTPLAAARAADAVVLVTDWPEYAELDLHALSDIMAGDVLVDGRNVFNPAAATRAGLRHVGIGRGHAPSPDGRVTLSSSSYGG